MKKKIAVLLAGVCVLSVLGGCGKNDNKDKDSSKEESTSNVEDYQAKDYVKLGEYMGLPVTLESYEVKEEDIISSINSSLSENPTYETLDKKVIEEGDFVNIDYEGLKDGVAFDGGADQGYVLEIGSDSFIEGFEEGLIGANVGETKALNLTFPEGYQSEELAGKAVVFNVTVNAIVKAKEMTYEALTDEYVKSTFGYETLQEYKDKTKETMETENTSAEESDKRSAVMEQLKEACTVEKLPDGVLDERVKDYKEQFAKMCKEQYQLEMADFLEQFYQMTEEDFDTQTVEYMKENVEMELILGAIADKEKIEIDEEGYQTYVSSMVANYGLADEKSLYEQNGEQYVKNSYLCNKALELVTESAKVTYNEPEEDANANADKEKEKDAEAEKEADTKDE